MTRIQLSADAATAAYADVFSYPLTKRELGLWRISVGTVPVKKTPSLVRLRGYVMLPGREFLISRREEKKKIAQRKWVYSRQIAEAFRFVPTVYLVGVTGGLSMDNAGAHDDIDLFFVTAPGTLWISRLFVTVVADMMGIRRHPNDRSVEDKACLNMFMAANTLSLPFVERDLFAAHEVLQMVPVWERGRTYAAFLSANTWVGRYLPAAWKDRWLHRNAVSKKSNTDFLSALGFLLAFFEPVAMLLQLRYMAGRRTKEVIRAGQIRFHPKDIRIWVRRQYALRLAKWGMPLDKIFYHPLK